MPRSHRLLLFLSLLILAAGCGRRLDPRAQEAYDLVVQNEIDQAVAFVNSILVEEPDNAQVRNVLGLALYKSGNVEGSIEQYLETLEDDPDFPEAHFNLGNSYKALGRRAEAESCYARAVRLEKKFVLAHYNLGFLYRDSGREEQALTCFRRAVDHDEQFYPALLELGLLLAAAGDSEGAISSFERVLELVPDFKEVRVHLGNAYIRSGREGAVELAENEFRAAVGIDPEYVEGIYSLGVSLASQQRQAEAVEQFERALTLTSDKPDSPIHRQVKAYFEQIGYTPADTAQAQASG